MQTYNEDDTDEAFNDESYVQEWKFQVEGESTVAIEKVLNHRWREDISMYHHPLCHGNVLTAF